MRLQHQPGGAPCRHRIHRIEDRIQGRIERAIEMQLPKSRPRSRGEFPEAVRSKRRDKSRSDHISLAKAPIRYFRLIQPNTRAEIQKLIRIDDRFSSFYDACIWPDDPRQRASEHFLNLPRDSDGLHSESCPGASACVVTAIRKDFDVLSSNNASQAQKLALLKFLGHWVGDIHQPLHVSFEDDRGGNSIPVTGICGADLHAAWDTCLVLGAVREDVGEAATELLKTITPARIESWNQSNPMDWQTSPSPSLNKHERSTAFDRVRPAIIHRAK